MWAFVWFVGTPVLVLLVALALEGLQRRVVDGGRAVEITRRGRDLALRSSRNREPEPLPRR